MTANEDRPATDDMLRKVWWSVWIAIGLTFGNMVLLVAVLAAIAD